MYCMYNRKDVSWATEIAIFNLCVATSKFMHSCYMSSTQKNVTTQTFTKDLVPGLSKLGSGGGVNGEALFHSRPSPVSLCNDY